MHGALVKIVAKPGKKRELLEFLRWDAAVAQAAEPGTLRFDVWDVTGEPNAVYLYEAYADEEAFERHKANEPFKRYEKVIDPELLDKSQEDRLVDFSESLISNTDVVLQTYAAQPLKESQATQGGNSGISKMSVGSFPLDAKSMTHFNDYAELRRLTLIDNARVAYVHFPPGVRTDWHRHGGQQLLYFVDGVGEVVLRGGRLLECLVGDIVRVDAGSMHWHGASAEHSTAHIAITVGETVWGTRPY